MKQQTRTRTDLKTTKSSKSKRCPECRLPVSKPHRPKCSRGFAPIELLIALAIILLIVSVVLGHHHH